MKIYNNVAIINKEYGIFCTYDGNFFDYEGKLIYTCKCSVIDEMYDDKTTKWTSPSCNHADDVCRCDNNIISTRHRSERGIKWHIYNNYIKYTLRCSRNTLLQSLNVNCNTLSRCSIKTFPELICIYPKNKHINMKLVNLLYIHNECIYILMSLYRVGILYDIILHIIRLLGSIYKETDNNINTIYLHYNIYSNI